MLKSQSVGNDFVPGRRQFYYFEPFLSNIHGIWNMILESVHYNFVQKILVELESQRVLKWEPIDGFIL